MATNVWPYTVTVYPRVCGGTLFTDHTLLPWMGLSPRVRGNLEMFLLAYLCPRSIPACAGVLGVSAIGHY